MHAEVLFHLIHFRSDPVFIRLRSEVTAREIGTSCLSGTNVSVKFSGSAPLHRAASVTPQFLQFFFEWSLWNFKSCMRSDCNEVLVVDCAVKFGERFYMYSVSCAFAYPYFILMLLTIWRLLLTRKGLLLLEKWT